MKTYKTIIAFVVTLLCITSSITTTDTLIQNEKTSTQSISVNTQLNNIEKSNSTNNFDIGSIPKYVGKPYIIINDNKPFFTEKDITNESFEKLSSLDALGRCGVAYANLSKELMPTHERGAIGMIKPTGWHTIRYENIDGHYLYNRCHLLSFRLTGNNADARNLITGTRYLNIEGMLPFENMVADYIKSTNRHALYRVTPIFDGNNLLASGVLMEGYSTEDNGESVCFNVYCYNVQPGIEINYANGESVAADKSAQYEDNHDTSQKTDNNNRSETTYILNTSTKKFHYQNCESVKHMKDKNIKYITCTRDQAISQGFSRCKLCNP